MKVHLLISKGMARQRRMIQPESFCGLRPWSLNWDSTFNLDEVTCKTCLKAHAAWQKRMAGQKEGR